MSTPELSPKTFDALALAGKRMFETGVHPHSAEVPAIFEAILAGYAEAEAAAAPKADLWEDPYAKPLAEAAQHVAEQGC